MLYARVSLFSPVDQFRSGRVCCSSGYLDVYVGHQPTQDPDPMWIREHKGRRAEESLLRPFVAGRAGCFVRL